MRTEPEADRRSERTVAAEGAESSNPTKRMFITASYVVYRSDVGGNLSTFVDLPMWDSEYSYSRLYATSFRPRAGVHSR
jgi:hypothetical protein